MHSLIPRLLHQVLGLVGTVNRTRVAYTCRGHTWCFVSNSFCDSCLAVVHRLQAVFFSILTVDYTSLATACDVGIGPYHGCRYGQRCGCRERFVFLSADCAAGRPGGNGGLPGRQGIG